MTQQLGGRGLDGHDAETAPRQPETATPDPAAIGAVADYAMHAAGILVPPVSWARKPTQGARGAATRQRIVSSARGVLATAPIGGISARAIAERADIARPTFYLYFDDIDHLMLELADEAGEAFVAGAARLAEACDAGQPLRLWCGDFVNCFITIWRQDPQVLVFRNLATDRGDRRFLSVWSRATAPWIRLLIERRLATRPGERPDIALVQAGMVISMCTHFAIRATGGARWDTRELSAALIAIMVEAFTPPDDHARQS